VTAGLKLATVRFYFDADVLGVAKVIAALRWDVTFPGDPGAIIHKRQRPSCPITKPSTPDHIWIPEVAERGWLIVTRDSHIQDHVAEIAAVRENGAKLVALSGVDAASTWLQLEVFMSQWRRLEALAEEDGPFIWRATRSGLNKLILDG
jgi:PIN like domain